MSHWSIEALQNTHNVYEDLPSFHLKKKIFHVSFIYLFIFIMCLPC